MCGDVEDLQLGKFRGEGGFCDVFLEQGDEGFCLGRGIR